LYISCAASGIAIVAGVADAMTLAMRTLHLRWRENYQQAARATFWLRFQLPDPSHTIADGVFPHWRNDSISHALQGMLGHVFPSDDQHSKD
jgi:hypothetical protein